MSKLTDLSTSLSTVADSDLLHVVDVSDTTSTPQGTSKKSAFSVLRAGLGNINYAELSIPTAQVLTLNGTPLEIVAASGAGKAIQVIAASCSLTFNSVAYATNTTLQLILDTATLAQVQSTNFLNASANRFFSLSLNQGDLIANKALQVKVQTGNPTAGDSDIKVYVFYRIITI